MSENTEQCSNCRFWFNHEIGEGECRRYAPRPTKAVEDFVWQLTYPDDWCGEHEPIESGEPGEDETLDVGTAVGDDNAL
jgi:hypothetical protein